MLEPKEIHIENFRGTMIRYPKDGHINSLYFNYEVKKHNHLDIIRDVFIDNLLLNNYKDIFKQIAINKDGTIRAF
ncbi:MAG: hypothetical protein IPJ01_11780 [Micavibrio sp.]|nr:hypothetical protein [Micavibrio sp.]